ncbi:penicillin-binding transpeptidase domain-containing protein (plasmid) [Rossellomorea sp. AcN35-11]|nr:penicillin-binding transpeptidase domain-containing protein [Rossellomorea sp. AcN35-11]
MDKLSKENLFQVEFGTEGKNLKPSVKNEIEALEIPGIKFRAESTRFYPNGIFASHAIGYSQYSEDLEREEGKMGIEKTYDKELMGKDGSVSYQTDKVGFKLPDPKEQIYLPEDGDDIFLTIDQKIQTFLEEAVSYVYEEYEAEKIMAVVADPKTGEILAMSSAPSFDPNVRDIEYYQNDIIEYAYEPGSTMKIFTLASYINEGFWNPNTLYRSGTYKISGDYHTIRDHNSGKGWGTISYLEGFQRSSNVLFSKIVNEELGTEKFKEYLDSFDFDTKTDIDLTGEKKGTILYNWPIEKITSSYGQGTTVTPMQLVKAMTAVANNGNMMQPFVVKKVVDSDTGEVIQENKPKVVGNPITPQTSETVLEAMETVVSSKKGTAQMYKLDGYKVAGKTGTAQIPDPEGGYMYGYSNYLFSFMGAVPADDPQFVMYVAVKKPKLELKEWGYEVGNHPVSYIFRKVMTNTLFYKNVEQTEIKKVDNAVDIEDFVGRSLSESESQLEELDVTVIGNGQTVVGQYPESGSRIKGTKVLLLTNGEKTMPDIEGWSLRDVMRLSELLGLGLSNYGNGFVSMQSVVAGEPIKQGDSLVVQLTGPNQEEQDTSQYEEAVTSEEELESEIDRDLLGEEGLGVIGP